MQHFLQKVFQSTLPRGSDLGAIQGRAAAENFNPRSLAGATNAASAFALCAVISIHAPSRERPNKYRGSKTCSNFNPRSLAGATVGHSFRVWITSISIHAPSRERLFRGMKDDRQREFQSTLPRGSDVCARTFGSGLSKFQSTLPRGSDRSKIPS